MEAITNAVNALVDERLWAVTQENKAHVERLKREEINVRKARSAAVVWRVRYDEMLERTVKAETALEELRREVALKTQTEQPPATVTEETEAQTVDPAREPTVTVYEGINYPTVSTSGPDTISLKNYTYEEALAKARELNCSIMVKKLHGNTWYLRGQDMVFETLKKSIDGLSKQKLDPGSATRTIYLIKH